MSPIKPMLAKKAEAGKVPSGGEYAFEVKWDGLRAIIEIKAGVVRLFSRSGKEITAQYPELQLPESNHIPDCILDSEIVCFGEDGKPSFRTAVGRRHNGNDADRLRRSKEAPATAILFDIVEIELQEQIIDLKKHKYEYRRDVLDTMFVMANSFTERYKLSAREENGQALYDAVKEQGLEGIVAKRKGGKYYPGKRSDDWLKIKIQQFADVKIVGYTPGEGRREKFFGALLLESMDGEKLGRVGTGFNDQMLADLRTAFDAIGTTQTGDEHFLKRPLVAEVKFIQKTINGSLREPVFMKLRTDLLEG